MFTVMLRCLTGTWRLVAGPAWEAEVHVITWCHEETREAAEATVAELRADRNPTLLEVWVA